MFERFKALARQVKESRSWPAILSLGYSGAQWMDANYQAFAKEGYVWNPDVYACINAGVRAFRGFKFGVYRHTGDGRELIEDGPLADLIKKPNSHQSWSSFVGEWFGCMEISGNAYVEGVSPGDKNSDILKRPPAELFVLRPDRMFVVAGNERVPVAGYEYRAGSLIVPYRYQLVRNAITGGLQPRCPVLHSKYWNPTSDWYGLSPVQAAARNIDAFNSAVSWNVALTQNVARPAGVFSTEDNTLDAVRAEEYTDLIRRKFQGAANAGRPMVLGKGLKWQQLGLTPVDMDWLKGLDWNTTKICAVFGVPPEIIGDSSNRTYSNFQEARKSVYLENWIPKADMLCEDLNNWLAPLFWEAYGQEVFIHYDPDSIEAIQEDRAVKWQNAKEGATFLTVNEQRQLVGLPAVPEGDVILVPSTLIPLSVAGSQTDMPGAQRLDPNQPTTPGQKPKPGQPNKKLPAGKKPVNSKPARGRGKKSVEFFPVLPPSEKGDILMRQIEDARERIKLLSAE